MNCVATYFLVVFVLVPLLSFGDNASCCIKYKVQFAKQNGDTIVGYYIHEQEGIAGPDLDQLLAYEDLKSIYGDWPVRDKSKEILVYKSLEKVSLFDACDVNGTTERFGYFVSPTNIVVVRISELKSSTILSVKNLCCEEAVVAAGGSQYCACIPTCQVVTELSQYKIQLIKDVAPRACTYLHYPLFGGIAIYSYSDKYTPRQVREKVDKALGLDRYDLEQNNGKATEHYKTQSQKLLDEKIIIFQFAIQI